MKSDNLLLTIAVLAVAASLIATGFTYFSLVNLAAQISGYATSTGQANLTVESQASINFTKSFVNWGSGMLNPGGTAASLTTFETNNVSGGNWTLSGAGGLQIENIGNINISLNLTGAKTAVQFIGGTNSVYKWNITNVEVGSCINGTAASSGNLDLNTFHNVNISIGASIVCPTFRFETGNDLIRIDFNLTIPEDSLTGALTDTITATAYV